MTDLLDGGEAVREAARQLRMPEPQDTLVMTWGEVVEARYLRV